MINFRELGRVCSAVVLGGLGCWHLLPAAAGTQVAPGGSEATRSTAVREASGRRPVRLDIVICVDSTGSMQDEIDAVKDKIKQMVSNIADGNPKPDVRFGIVTYRDRGDTYITLKFPLTTDIDQVKSDVGTIKADGGGDGPESVNEALHVAVEEMNWDTNPGVSRMVFLIGDAPPHMDYDHDYDYRSEIIAAITRRIVIHTVACSGIEEYGKPEQPGSAINIFQEIALRTEGRFDYITYLGGADGDLVQEGGKSYKLTAAGKPQWRQGGHLLMARGLAKEQPRSEGARRKVNNLDLILTRTVQAVAQSRGVAYLKQEARAVHGKTLVRSPLSGLRDPLKTVVTSLDKWQDLWSRHTSGSVPPLALPTIDFERQAVVLLALGEQTADSRSVEITRVEVDDKTTLVHYHVRTTTVKLAEPCQPVHIIVIDKPQGDVQFVEDAPEGKSA